jgi:hypothetical protein
MLRATRRCPGSAPFCAGSKSGAFSLSPRAGRFDNLHRLHGDREREEITMGLYELVYTSVCTDNPVRPQTLIDILREARERNGEHGITGMLLFANGEFVQQLEGERDKVRWLYHDLITGDPRHRNATVVWEGPLAARNFPEWRMGFVRPLAERQALGPSLDAVLPDMPGLQALTELAGQGSIGKRLLNALVPA